MDNEVQDIKQIKSEGLVSDSLKTLLVMLIFNLLLSTIINMFFKEQSTLIVTLLYYVLITVFPVVLFIRLKAIEKPLEFLKLDNTIKLNIAVKSSIIGILLALGILSFMFLIIEIFGMTISNDDNLFGGIINYYGYYDDGIFYTAFQLILVYVLSAGIFEEIFFRGFLMNSLRPLGRKTAVFISSLTFALYHFHPIRVIITFTISMIWGNIAYIFKNTKYSILMHIFYNFTATVFLIIIILSEYGYINIEFDLYTMMGLQIFSIIFSASVIKMLYLSLVRDNYTNNLVQENEIDIINTQAYKTIENLEIITVDDYTNPKIINLNKSARIYFAFYLVLTLSVCGIMLFGV